jgi:agmatinase
MKFPSFFADSETSFSKADFVIIGATHEDLYPSFRQGAADAPNAIREASWNFETFNLFNEIDLCDISIHDAGNLPGLKDVQKLVSRTLQLGKTPIIMGGSHSVSPVAVSSFSKHIPDLGVLILDAHLDYRDKYMDTPQSHACATRRIAEIVGLENVIVVGVRSACKKEKHDADRQGLHYYTSFDVAKQSIGSIIESLDFKHIYLSIDMDSLDPSYAPGVGTPEPFGIRDVDVLEILMALSSTIVGMDVVEICPAYDTGNAALLAAKFIREYITWKTKG